MGKDLYIYKGERKAKGEGLEYIPIQLDRRKRSDAIWNAAVVVIEVVFARH